jgi:tetratricopeptide (TPR) repeat protein
LSLSLLLGLAAAVATPDAATLHQQALQLRASGQYASAVSTLEHASRLEPQNSRIREDLGETLAWDQRFAEAEAVYRKAIDELGSSRDLELGLARVQLWEKRYTEAARRFRVLLGAGRNDVDALEGLAQATYWSGDFRTARRLFQRLLAVRPDHPEAERSLQEIDLSMRPLYRIRASILSDDQPLDAARSDAAVTLFADPLTHFEAGGGFYQLDADRINRNVPYASVGAATKWPSLNLAAELSARYLRFPDETSRMLGGLKLTRSFERDSVSMSWQQSELLATATSLDDHPSVNTTSLRWEHSSKWLAAASVSDHRYFDDNRGSSADFWILMPVYRNDRVTLLAGPSAAFRDTEENRFEFNSVDSIPEGPLFRYRFRGVYDPYWTPHDLVEARLNTGVKINVGRALVNVRLSGGYARDRFLTFAPDRGSTPLPSFTFPFFLRRDYKPWEAITDVTMPFRGLQFSAAYRHTVTVFYKADALEASLVGKF